MNTRLLLFATAALLTACVDEVGKSPPLAPNLGEGKADAGDRVQRLGDLGLGAEHARTGVFAEDLEFHGYELRLGADADVRLEVTQRGSRRGLDTTMFVFGPRDERTGAFGGVASAVDDDAGYGRLSLIKSFKAEGGTYLVVVGTADGRGRGNYRLEARCNGQDCAPAEARCHPALRTAIEDCVASWMDDPEADPAVTTTWEMTYLCADAEPLSRARDVVCETTGDPMCALDIEGFARGPAAECRTEALHAHYDTRCIFGEVYRDLFGPAEAMVVLGRATLRQPGALDDLRRAQVLAAVQTAYAEVSRVEDAFAAVDEELVHVVELWDASNRRGYTAYEFGAGDNSYGAIFGRGTATIVAKINDGDLLECEATWGEERRRCWANEDCRAGSECVGRADGAGLGRCVMPGLDVTGGTCEVDARAGTSGAAPDESAALEAQLQACPADALCAGSGGVAECVPAWGRGAFAVEPAATIPDQESRGLESQLAVFGLPDSVIEVRLDLHVDHPRPDDLRLDLRAPDGEVLPVFPRPGVAGRGEIVLRGVGLVGLEGVSANGLWRLQAVDTRSGEVGTLYRFGLEVTAR